MIVEKILEDKMQLEKMFLTKCLSVEEMVVNKTMVDKMA
jgi:hypothetical protein